MDDETVTVKLSEFTSHNTLQYHTPPGITLEDFVRYFAEKNIPFKNIKILEHYCPTERTTFVVPIPETNEAKKARIEKLIEGLKK